MWWVIGTIANLVTAIAYLAIAAAILIPLIQEKQVRTNRLGTATAAIFFTCAVHHGSHSVHMLLPYFGLETDAGLSLRNAFDWHPATWDLITAGVGVYYWTLRRTYSSLMHGAKLFDDLRERERQALEINDNIVQGLAEAHLALQLGEQQQSEEALAATLVAARRIITDLLGQTGTELRLGPGDLRRAEAAALPR